MKRLLLILLVLLLACAPALAGQLRLEDCLRLARQHNPTLKSAAYDQGIARTALTRARSAYLPRVDLRGGYTMQKDAQAFALGGASEPTQEADYGSFSLQARQTLYDFGRTASRVARAGALEKAAGLSRDSLAQDVFLRTVVAYYRILAGGELVQAAREEVTQMRNHLHVARSLFAEGVVTRNDVLQAQVRLADSRQLLLSRQKQVQNAWLDLNYLTGRPAGARGSLAEESQVEPPPAAGVAQAVASRPDLRAQQLRIAAARQQVKESRSGFWPELFLQAGADYVQNKYVKQQTIYAATLGFSVNLFAGGSTQSTLRQSVETLARDREHLRDMEQQARRNYRTARNDARVARQRIAVARKAISQGEENLRINENRYAEQVGTATEVLDAQTLLTRMRTEYAQARFDYQVAVARIRRASGSL